MSHNENFIGLVGVTKSSKFQALQVQHNDFTSSALSKEVSIFGSPTLVSIGSLRNIVKEHLFDQTLNA